MVMPSEKILAVDAELRRIRIAYGLNGTEGLIEGSKNGELFFKDKNMTTGVNLSEAGNLNIDTFSQSIVGALNELRRASVLSSGITGCTACAVSYATSPTNHYHVTLSGANLAAYVEGVKVAEIVDGWESPALEVGAGITANQYLYYDVSASHIVWSPDPWEFEDIQIAVLLFNANGYLFGIRDTHGFMDAKVHHELHEVIGCYRDSGGDLSGVVFGSSTASQRRPAFSACEIWDEDIQHILAEKTAANYTNFYLSGATGVENFSVDQAEFVLMNSTNPRYNAWNGSAWTLMDVPSAGNSNYSCVWTLAIPACDDTGSQKYRFVHLIGQQVGTLASQQALNTSNVTLGTLATLAPEIVFIEKTIIRGGNAGAWTVIESAKITGSARSQIAVSGGQFLTSVTADNRSLAGIGTPADPLRIYEAQPITTSDDGTTGLTVSSARQQLFTGSGSNHVVSLPDARTFAVGKMFKFFNAGTNFVIVKNYGTASSCFEFVGPGCTLECLCTSITSAAGVWVCSQSIPRDYYVADNDFQACDGNTIYFNGWAIFNGSGSGQNVTGGASNNRRGVNYMSLGTGTGASAFCVVKAGGYSIAKSEAPLNHGVPYFYQALADVSALSDGSQTYSSRFGVFDVLDHNQPANGVYFETDADGDLIPVCRAASSETTIAAGGGKIALSNAASNSLLTWIANAASTRVDFWVNKTYTGKIEATIPKTAQMVVGAQAVKSAGALDRLVYVDRITATAPRGY